MPLLNPISKSECRKLILHGFGDVFENCEYVTIVSVDYTQSSHRVMKSCLVDLKDWPDTYLFLVEVLVQDGYRHAISEDAENK